MTTTHNDATGTSPEVGLNKGTRRLRAALRANGVLSLAVGGLAAVAPGALDGLLGIDATLWTSLVGIGLAGYAGGVLVLAETNSRHLLRWTPVVVVADVAWIVASCATILAGWYSPSGTVAVATSALLVGLIAWRQHHHRVHLAAQ